MFVLRAFASALILLASLPSHGQTPRDAGFAARINNFGSNLLHHHAGLEPRGNRVVSPLANYVALAMVAGGATQATAALLTRQLGLEPHADDPMLRLGAEYRTCYEALIDFDTDDRRATRLGLANSAWISTGLFRGRRFELDPDYKAQLQAFFGTLVTTTDFRDGETAPEINRWVNNATLGEIKQLVTAEDVADLMMLFINATYFRGWWHHDFDEVYGEAGRMFRLADGSTVPVDAIATSGDFAHVVTPQAEMIEIPFRPGSNQEFVFYAALPHEGVDLATFRAGAAWAAARQSLAEAKPTRGSVTLPTFEFQDGFQMIEGAPLTRALGLDLAFSDFATFDDLKTTESPPAKIGLIKNLNRFALDQSGVTASAAATVGLALGGGAPGKPEFAMKIDRPFAFAVAEKKTGVMIFVGEVDDPRH